MRFVRIFWQLNWNLIGNWISFSINSDPVIHRINDVSNKSFFFCLFVKIKFYLLNWVLFNRIDGIGVFNNWIFLFNIWLFSIHWLISILYDQNLFQYRIYFVLRVTYNIVYDKYIDL